MERNPWKVQQEKTLRSAVRQAVTAELGRCQEPPFTPDEAADICIDEIRAHTVEGDPIKIEGYTEN